MRSLSLPAVGGLPGFPVADPGSPTDAEDIAHNAEVNRLIRAELDAAVVAGESPPLVRVDFPDSPPDVLTLDRDGNLAALVSRH